MATSDTTPRVSTLFHCVLFTNRFPPPKRLQLKANATELLVMGGSPGDVGENPMT